MENQFTIKVICFSIFMLMNPKVNGQVKGIEKSHTGSYFEDQKRIKHITLLSAILPGVGQIKNGKG